MINDYIKKTTDFLNKHEYIIALLITLMVVIAGAFMGWYNNKVVIQSPNPIGHYNGVESHGLSFLANWDGNNYISIAEHGYPTVKQANFMPLYPMLIKLVNLVVPSPLASGLIVSWACLSVAIFFLIKIVKELFNVTTGIKSLNYILFFVFFPTSIFLVAVYTEAMFAMLAFGAIFFALKRKYLLSGLLLSLDVITHINGIFVVPLVLILLYKKGLPPLKILATMVISGLGLAGFSAYLLVRFNSPLAFVLSQQSHGWLNQHYNELFSSVDLFNLIFVILILISAYYWYRRKRIEFSVYSLAFLLIPLIGNQWGGFNRYMLSNYPISLMIYDALKNKEVLLKVALIATSIAWAYFTFQFAGGYIGG